MSLYPEYTGTLSHEILAGSGVALDQDIRRALADRGILMTRPLGFNNLYAIGMREIDASRLGDHDAHRPACASRRCGWGSAMNS